MGKFAELIKYEGDNSTFIWKHPCEDFNSLTQLVVHESQEAIFFMNGQALDLFGPGRYTLETENIPRIGKLLNRTTGDTSPFHCEVYFINKTEQMSLKWGTDSKIQYIEPTYGFPLSIGASGEMSLRVADSRKLLVKLVGTESFLGQQKLVNFFRAFLMTRVKTYIAQVIKASAISIFEIDEHLTTFSESIHKLLIPDFADYGVALEQFFVTTIVKPDGDRQYEKFKELHLHEENTMPVVLKCKMCGGTLEFSPGDTVAVCDSCGTKQTLPKLDDDRRSNLYDRANHFRRNNEYDKAMGIYEQILNEDKTDAEAYWSLVLCRYGIEYVEDPATHKRVPTVNRAQFTSIFDDDNYKSALHYADAAQREIYESEAKAINEIQKGILAISQKEQPFDVFICYKETDSSGRRTQDSVLANDLYHQLTQEGFKVFFSRITLEDKLGTAYEPYIFAALNSAKVMVVLGTKPEYFNAVWVKNEWSRYLALIKNGAKKVLIPAYRDMDPYDLPEEFSHLQAQDMSKLGFMQQTRPGLFRGGQL